MSKIEKWKDVLGWKRIPNFGKIHSLDSQRFLGYYYKPNTVDEFIKSIVYSMEEGYGFGNKTIIGEPGSGKTTFIYYLKQEFRNHKGLAGYHIEIIHFNRLASIENVYSVVEKRVLTILLNYFSEIGLGEIYTSILAEAHPDKEKINILEDIIKNKNRELPKRLLIIIDDVDETDTCIVETAVRYFFSLLECEQIAKWLVVRATTLDFYERPFLDFIETKFPVTHKFPRVDLFGILDKRIMFDNPDGINPFTSDLSSMILLTYEYDLRRAVENCVSFLELSDPTQGSKNNPQFAGQYLIKNYTSVMTRNGCYPNIYFNSVSHLVPLERDLFIIIARWNRFYSAYLTNLIDYYQTSYKSIHKGVYSSESYLINLTMEHIEIALKYLESHKLITTHSHIKEFYKLTIRGESFVKFVTEILYSKECMLECESGNKMKHPVFWELTRQFPVYENQKAANST